ncbi:YkvI family membrane protein [Virgibacillus sp. W0430]|uniref:YkvI family membrane protein n=1 Tax=Virgibacillus sp. W0430 TaxID=3391580 RepID=UPI003F453A76
MKKTLKIGSAFIGIIVGAGFASGQEVLQYFTSFGSLGTLAALVATIMFAYLGMTLTKIGSIIKTRSHKEVIYHICGRYIGIVVDAILVLTLFGVGVVMVAGAGSIFDQQFGLPAFIGSFVMTVLFILTAMLNVERVITVIGSITPFLILSIVIIGVYSLLTMEQSFTALDPIAKAQPSSLSNWFISAINYVSFNIAVGASMALVMGGAEENKKTAALGGLLGGLGIGVLILISHLAIFSKIGIVANVDMPILKIVDGISPIIGIIMSVILFGMIFNTAVSMFYAFAARFVNMQTKKGNIFIVVTGIVAFAASFVGFTNLVRHFYPFIGFLGLFLVGALIYAPFKLAKTEKQFMR